MMQPKNFVDLNKFGDLFAFRMRNIQNHVLSIQDIHITDIQEVIEQLNKNLRWLRDYKSRFGHLEEYQIAVKVVKNSIEEMKKQL